MCEIRFKGGVLWGDKPPPVVSKLGNTPESLSLFKGLA